MVNIASFLQSVKLPVMQEVAQALIRTLNDDQADVAAVTTIIAKDPVLTTTLLRMANAFAFPPGINRLDFWRSSMVCAGYARWLAASIGLDEQQAWLTGMMLRLGEIVIAQRMPDVLERVESLPCGPGERWKRERELAGFDEGEVSAEIARHWDFPEAVALALRCAAQPLAHGNSRLAAVVHLAALITDQAGGGPPSLDNLPVSVVHTLGLNTQKLQLQIPDAESLSDISMLQS